MCHLWCDCLGSRAQPLQTICEKPDEDNAEGDDDEYPAHEGLPTVGSGASAPGQAEILAQAGSAGSDIAARATTEQNARRIRNCLRYSQHTPYLNDVKLGRESDTGDL